MKKLLLTSVVAGIFLAGCGENLPNEITSHENFKSCQQVEKNLLTIQSSFEKDERADFYTECNKYFDKYSSIKEIIEGGDDFKKIAKILKENKESYAIESLSDLFVTYSQILLTEAQKTNRVDNMNNKK